MIKRLLAFAAGFALATLAEAVLPLSKVHAQSSDPQIHDGG